MKPAERWLFPLLLVLAAALAIGTAGWGHLYNETDGQYGGAAKVMAQGGSWLVPDNNGIPRLVKPPLLYWAMACGMKIFGINEFAARLPNALAVILWIVVVYRMGARSGGPWRGFLAGAILLTSLGTFTLGRIVMPEPLFSALIALALYCVLQGHDDAVHRGKWFLGFWLCASLASFTKGWHGLLYPLAITGLAALLCKSARPNLRGLLSWQGLLIFAIINLPWYFSIEAQFPGWTRNLFFAEQMGHVTGSSAPATSYTDVPRWQFLLLHLAWFFPWSAAILLAVPAWRAEIVSCFHRPAGAEKPRFAISFDAALICSWGGIILGSVLLTGERQDYYAMSMWPAVALAGASLLERVPVRATAIFLAVLFAAGLFAPMIISPDHATASVAERATAWTTVTNFDQTVWNRLRLTGWLALGSALAFCLLAAWRGGRTGLLALVGVAVCLDLGAVNGTSLVAPFFSLADAAPEIRSSPGRRLVYDGGLDTGSSLLFYTDSSLTLLDQNAAEDFLVRKFGMGRDRFLTTKEFTAIWKSGVPVTLITESAKLAKWNELLGGQLKSAARCGTQVILRN